MTTFSSVRRLESEPLSWLTGVPMFAILPYLLMTLMVEGWSALDVLVPRWSAAVPTALLRGLGLAVFAPRFLADWISGSLSLPPSLRNPIFFLVLAVFGTLATWTVRAVQLRGIARAGSGERSSPAISSRAPGPEAV